MAASNPTPTLSTSTHPPHRFSPPPLQFPAENAPPPSKQPFLRHLAALSLISFFSIWGTLTREGLVALNTYDGMSIKPLIWAQAVGCFAMGWCIGNQKQIEGWYTPLYIGLTTGYCGSVTTFSSWILEVFRSFGNQGHFNRGGFHNVMDALTQTATTFGMSFISLQAGQALSQYLTFEIILILLNPSRWGEIRGQSTAEDEKIERDERDELDEEIVEETERAERDEENDVVYPPPTGEEEREERGTAEPSSKEMLDENKREVKQGWSDDSNAEKFGKAQKAEERNGSYPPMNNPKSTSRSIPNTISSSSASHHRSSSLGQSSNSSAFRRTDDVSIPEDSTLNSLSPTFTKDLMFIPIGIILWISSVFLCVFKTSSTFRPITISILFSPLGAITRWYLSRLNGISRAKRFPFFPLGTLSANLSATLIISLAFLCQRFGRNVSSSRSSSGIVRTTLGCNVLYGLQEGFCGTLSTVSTFAVELTKLKPKRRAINYAGFSWVAGILICVIVVGVPWWTRGMDGSCVGITI